jgi:hypothetical protein
VIDAGQSKFRFDIGRNDLYTVRERIAWSYANLACAHAALSDGRIKHNRVDWMIRAKLFRGLREGTMRMGSLFDDERAQLIEMPVCAYCGVEGSLSIDHLIPRVSGGSHAQHNLLRPVARVTAARVSAICLSGMQVEENSHQSYCCDAI